MNANQHLQAAPAVQMEPVGYVSPRLLDALRSGKACGITMEDKPDAHNGATIPLYAASQLAEQKPSTHWSYDNPGLADQYRAEAMAARRSVGFEQDAYDVAPADIAAAIESLQSECEKLRMDAKRYRCLLEAVRREIPHRKGSRGNAPGHAHSVPGIWDEDNGALAGKECAWCKVWSEGQV